MLREKKAHPFLAVNGRPLLLEAVDGDDEDLVGALLELGLSADVVDSDGYAPLATALDNDKLALAQRLVDGGARVNGDVLGRVARSGKVETLAWALDHGGDVNAKNVDGRTALIETVERWHSCSDVARLLVERGVDVNAFDRSGKSALTFGKFSFGIAGA